MGKKVLVVSSSPRKNGNSETLADAFANGAREAGHSVETVLLREKQLGFGRGCLACLKLGRCVIQDDAVEIAAKMHDADVLVSQRPSATASAGSSRPCWTAPTRSSAPIMHLPRCIYWQRRRRATSSTFEGTEKAVRGWVDCFPRRALAGTVFAGGVSGVGEIAGHPALEQARRMGMEI